ncbi:MAG: magnesium transporter [Verrucomicrobiota bacterium]
MIGNLLAPELKELIRQRDFTQLRAILCDFPAPDIAEIFVDLKPGDEAVLLRLLPHDVAAEVFECLPREDQEQVLLAMGTEEVAGILNDLSPDDRTALLEELPSAVTQKLLALLKPEERKIATDLLGYPKDSIGRRMTPAYIAVKQNWTVAEVLEHLRRERDKSDAVNQLYVVDDRGRLVDFVRLRELVVADAATPVTELLQHQNLALNATDDQEAAVAAFKKYDSTILPVVDGKGVIVGVVTVDDVLDLAEKEATEDIQKLGGVEALDAPYLKIGMLSMVKKRAGWLSALFLGEMLTASAMNHFEGELASAIVLGSFIPLIISSGGNSGSQATSLIIRSLAVRDVSLRDWWRVMRREIMAGLALGCVLAALGAIRILTWQYLGLKDYGQHFLLIAATVSCSLIGVVLFGSLAGAMLPFILRRLGFDPAVSSAPFVATLVDVTGLVIYFSVAYAILHGTLL